MCGKTYALLDISQSQASRDMRVEIGSGGRGDDLRAVDESAGIVADDGEHTHDELEVTLELNLVVCGALLSAAGTALGKVVYTH